MLHEVNFYEWCPKCEHFKLAEHEDPCHDCLNQPVNDDSRKPVEFKEGSSGEGKKSKLGSGKVGTVGSVNKINTVVRTRKTTVTGKPI